MIAEVRDVTAAGQLIVAAGGHLETVDGSLVDPVRAGDLVLLHAGVAINHFGETGP
ncbi:MAG TPA: HypC/HybG/HupF family hydrogenase formation chaperone [Acidimicrobiales bacterium]|nr:HypC/HybG/HupF family hydrogenase formation chaperone [Acidimicrobiales bacterium]